MLPPLDGGRCAQPTLTPGSWSPVSAPESAGPFAQFLSGRFCVGDLEFLCAGGVSLLPVYSLVQYASVDSETLTRA